MDATITFEIPGQPVPQPRARVTRSGHAYTPDNGIRAYKAATVLAAKMATSSKIPSVAPHAVEMTFVIERPASHRRRDGGLTKSAPWFPPRRCGDWDNLAKGVCDAITDSGAVWLDDDQVIEALIRRRYAAAGEQARTVVAIRRLDHEAAP